jgi:hypothetical protein
MALGKTEGGTTNKNLSRKTSDAEKHQGKRGRGPTGDTDKRSETGKGVEGPGKTNRDRSATDGDGLALDAGEGIDRVDSAGHEAAGKGHKNSQHPGLDRILEPEKNDDEFGKGIVGMPKETEGLAEGGNQEGMDGAGGEETLLYGGGYFEREKAGLEDGVSLRETMNADSIEPNYNYDIDPMTGNAPERKVGRTNNYVVQGKRKNKFLIGEM